MPFSTYFKNALLDLELRGTALAQPTNIYVGFTLTAGGATATGVVGEPSVSGTGISRVAVARADAQWTAPATETIDSKESTVIENVNDIEFASATIDVNDRVEHIFIADAAGTGAGNLIWHSEVLSTANRREFEQIGDKIIIPAGALKLGFSGGITRYLAAAWLNHFFRTTAHTNSGTLYLLLAHSSGLTRAGISNEASAGNYARHAMTVSGTPDFDAASDGAIANTNIETFSPTPDADWAPSGSEINQVGLADASSGGNLLLYHGLGSGASAYEIVASQPVSIGVGNLTFNIQDI